MDTGAELIGTVSYYASKYGIYRMPGRADNLEPWYYGAARLDEPPPYCFYSSLKSLFRSFFTGRVEFKPLEGYDGPRI